MFFTPLLSGNKGCACIIRACNYSFSGAVLQEQHCNEKTSKLKTYVDSCIVLHYCTFKSYLYAEKIAA